MIEINECRIDQFSYEPTIREKIVALRNKGLSDSMIEFALLNDGLELRTEYLFSRHILNEIIENVNAYASKNGASSQVISEYAKNMILNDIPKNDGISTVHEVAYYLEWITEVAIRSIYPEENNFRINKVAEYLCKRAIRNRSIDKILYVLNIERPVA